MTLSTPVPSPRFARAAALLAGSAALAAGFLAARTGLGVFRPLTGLALWIAAGALVQGLPAWRFHLRTVTVGGFLLGGGLWLAWPRTAVLTGATDTNLQLAAVLGAVTAFLCHFLATLGRNLARDAAGPSVALIAGLRLLAAAHLLVAGAALALSTLRRPWLAPVQGLLGAVLAVLVAEAVGRWLARWYQPRRLRAPAAALGESVLLPFVFGESRPLRSLVAGFERHFGVRLGEAWLVRFARALAAPLALLALLAAWLATAVTVVPVDATGVLVERGAFAATPLPPGWHVHAPWPWARVVAVPTGRLHELSLGFERDLAGPVLWAEKHFEGEQNLLVGSGEELLTVNVPVQYRIRDAVAWLQRTGDSPTALTALGGRELLALAAGHTAFGLMTTDRDAAAERLRSGLQAACDRLGLGIEIVFVGLKDVHPPVAVTSAYQDVVSAEEEHATLVDQARTYAAQALGAAQVAARFTRTRAEADAAARRAAARGETARFLSPLATWRAHPAEFRIRLRYEALEAALAAVPRLYVVPPGHPSAHRSFFLGPESWPAATR